MCSHDQTTQLDRRVLLKFGAGLAGASLLPRPLFAQTGTAEEPHFFLMVNYQGSFDSSYLFDSRPLAMTAAGKIQNYLNKEPGVWTGVNGVTSRCTELVNPLKEFQQYFSVLNGVQMAVNFDGHDQNGNFLVAGNPFGGDAFYADLNHAATQYPLDFLQLGTMFGVSITNGSAGVTLDAATAPKLSAAVAKAFNLNAEPAVMDLVRARLQANGAGAGAFSRGSQRMAAGLGQSKGLAATLASMEFPTPNGTDPALAMANALAAVAQYFQKGATRSALISLQRINDLDTHSPQQAAAQPATYAKVVADFVTLFKTLKETPYDAAAGKSLLDVTTVLIAPEFGRTMYQHGLAMDKTGTDHNPLSNEIILGGKGIKGGLVVGASDLQNVNADGTLVPFSDAHKSFDPEGIKTMGKAFDFQNMVAVEDLPATYDPTHYLTVASVINTVFKSFAVDTSHYWTLGRNLPTAATLDGLLG